MVKVIKYGQKRRVTCNHCGAVLEFDNNDLETYQVDWNVLNVQLALRL